jgi:hypothetical protein
MRVIHGLWVHEALCLWAEDPALPPRGPEPAASLPGRPSRAPQPHPFACQAAELADLLAGLPGPAREAARKAVDDELTLQLPSAADGPLASPELIRPETPDTRTRCWTTRRPTPGLDPSLPCVSIPRRGCLACW